MYEIALPVEQIVDMEINKAGSHTGSVDMTSHPEQKVTRLTRGNHVVAGHGQGIKVAPSGRLPLIQGSLLV